MSDKLPANALWKQFSRKGIPAHFYHANGFPFGVYTPLLDRLARQFSLSALGWRATWPDMSPPPSSRTWQIYADDLIHFIQQHYDQPIIGIGHSMGATCTILAAVKRPDLFKALVLIEPAMVAKPLALLARLLPKSVMNRTEPAGSTLKKRDSWPTRQAFLDHCKGIRGYKRFTDEAFLAMAEHGVIQGDDGRFYLAFPKIWEAHNYTQPPNVMDELEGMSLPCLAVRGRPSVFFTQTLWDQWQRRCPETLFMEDLSSGHLLPLENPDRSSHMIASGVWDLLGR